MNVIWIGCRTKCYSISSLIFVLGRSRCLVIARKLFESDHWSQDLAQALVWGREFCQSCCGEESSGGYMAWRYVHNFASFQVSSSYLKMYLQIPTSFVTFCGEQNHIQWQSRCVGYNWMNIKLYRWNRRGTTWRGLRYLLSSLIYPQPPLPLLLLGGHEKKGRHAPGPLSRNHRHLDPLKNGKRTWYPIQTIQRAQKEEDPLQLDQMCQK